MKIYVVSLALILTSFGAVAGESGSEMCRKLNSGLKGKYAIQTYYGTGEKDFIEFIRTQNKFSILIMSEDGMGFPGTAHFFVEQDGSCLFERTFFGNTEKTKVREVVSVQGKVVFADLWTFGKISELKNY